MKARVSKNRKIVLVTKMLFSTFPETLFKNNKWTKIIFNPMMNKYDKLNLEYTIYFSEIFRGNS